MQIKIDPRLFREYPGLHIGVIVATNIHNATENESAYALFKKQQDSVKRGLEGLDIAKHSHIHAWQEAYKKFGGKPKDNLSSVENLVRRVLSGQQLRSINTLVDLYNTVSLKYLLPAGGENLDAVQGDIQLTIATEHEAPVTLLGEKEARSPRKGEVIYKDEIGALVRRWNWKEAERSKLTAHTKNAILVLESLSPVNRHVIELALHELAGLIKEHCGGNVTVALLDEQHPAISLKNSQGFVALNDIKSLDTTYDLYSKENHIKLMLNDEASHQEAAVSDEHKVRVHKVEEMRAQGVEPWPQKQPVNATAAQVVQEYVADDASSVYQLAGRIVALRLHGKTAFMHLLDRTGKVQVYVKEDVVGQPLFEFLKSSIDLGDIVWVEGRSFKTKTGEITVKAERLVLLSKCLHPLPEKFHGLTDVETRYRQRYLDLISNPEARARFMKRSMIISTIRHFLEEHDFIEVETPMLHPIPGGAAARPFITHHNALGDDFYLRIAPELYLKRLVVGGFERVFEINRNFRNEGVSTRHNPEFTMLEFYMAHEDYKFSMDFVEELIKTVAKKVVGGLQLPFGTHILNFDVPFDRLNAQQAITKYAGIPASALTPTSLDATLAQHNVIIENKKATFGEKLFKLFEEVAEMHLIQPTFIIDFPIEISPLAKRDPQNPAIASRFELFMAGMEISNSFTELNDPFDQAARFREQVQAREAGDTEAHYFDQDFITALEYGMPPAVGVGIGIDRLVMLMTNTTSIKDVILFPTLKKR